MKHVKKTLCLLLTAVMLFSLAACGTAAPEETAAETVMETAPAVTQTAEVPEEQKPVLLVVSFGTSYNESRDLTIGAVEAALQQAYPDYEVRRAFTSQIIIDILKDRENLEIDNVTQAMDRLVADGVREVVVQPTHVMSGFEYDDVVKEVSKYQKDFDRLTISKTLLAEDRDYDTLISALAEETKEYAGEDAAVVFMGHGTEHKANATYERLQKRFAAAG